MSEAPSKAKPEVLLALLAEMGRWEPFCGPSGAHLWRVPGSKGETYVLSDRSCTCPADEYRRDSPCKHRQTLALYRQFVLTYLGHVRTFRCLCAARFPKEETRDNVRELRQPG